MQRAWSSITPLNLTILHNHHNFNDLSRICTEDLPPCQPTFMNTTPPWDFPYVLCVWGLQCICENNVKRPWACTQECVIYQPISIQLSATFVSPQCASKDCWKTMCMCEMCVWVMVGESELNGVVPLHLSHCIIRPPMYSLLICWLIFSIPLLQINNRVCVCLCVCLVKPTACYLKINWVCMVCFIYLGHVFLPARHVCK
jgi:hypothetical protein